ncbi:MAG: hypothetical protein JNK76_08490 [Planctomycetales bacterium]|nr:hypothetical protein [Planctomycetales bacterium]
MVKKAKSAKTENSVVTDAKVNKSAAIRDYLAASPDAKPKEIVAALSAKGDQRLAEHGLDREGDAKIKSALKANESSDGGTVAADGVGGLDAVLLLYKATQGRGAPKPRVRQAFLTLVDLLGYAPE